jgi:hypothetical protein
VRTRTCGRRPSLPIASGRRGGEHPAGSARDLWGAAERPGSLTRPGRPARGMRASDGPDGTPVGPNDERRSRGDRRPHVRPARRGATLGWRASTPMVAAELRGPYPDFVRITGECAKLGVRVSMLSVRNVLGRHRLGPAPRRGGLSWRWSWW